MFSQIVTPSARARENTDALMVRKPGTIKIAREPLADKAVNPSLTKLKPKLEQSKPKLEKAKPKPAPSEIKKHHGHIPDWYGDMCSFKDTQLADTYDDIWAASQRLSSTDFLNSLKPPKTPPFAFNIDNELLPMLVEIPKKFVFQEFPNIIEEEPIDDVECPDFDSTF